MTDHAGNAPRFTLKGWHVLAMLVAFFGVIIAVNTVFVTLAFQTFRGEDERRSYMQGLAYNEVLDDRRAQAELGWVAAVNLEDGRVLAAIETSGGEPVRGLQLDGVLRHPADMSRDHALSFEEIRPGVYAAAADPGDGRWVLTARHEGEPPFELERELWRR